MYKRSNSKNRMTKKQRAKSHNKFLPGNRRYYHSPCREKRLTFSQALKRRRPALNRIFMMHENIDPKTVQEVIELFEKVETGERKILDIMFTEPLTSFKEYEHNLEKMKRVFRLKSKQVIKEVQSDDWQELNQGFVKSLEDHFIYWDRKIKEVNHFARSAMRELQTEQEASLESYNEILQNLEYFMLPADKVEYKRQLKTEEMLYNMFKVDEARAMRKKARRDFYEGVEKGLDRRKERIMRKKTVYQYEQRKEMEALYNSIVQAHDRLVIKRREEFTKLMTKYVKVYNVISNAHHKEDCELKVLQKQYDFDVYKRRCCNKTTFNTDKGVVRRVENLNTIRGHVEEEFNEITPRYRLSPRKKMRSSKSHNRLSDAKTRASTAYKEMTPSSKYDRRREQNKRSMNRQDSTTKVNPFKLDDIEIYV